MIKKFGQFITEDNSENLLYYAFDWDDNILNMTTVIHMEHLVNGEWVPEDVSTSKFAEVRTDVDNWKILSGDPELAFSEFRDNGPRGEVAFKEDREVIIESFLKGREVTCSVVKTSKESITFPVTEIISKNEFFDYEAKYEGKSEEITPADIDEDITKKCQLLSSDIYDYANCKGIIRVDFILKGNQLYFLELNTIPGMSKESIVPQQIRANNMKVEDILKLVIEDSLA
jgi:hypothetical protein